MAKEEAIDAKKTAQLLVGVLSDTYVLMVKTHGFHWNIVGCGFYNLHILFKEHYMALIEAADEIAERIRALGLMPDGSMDSFLQNATIKEAGTKLMCAQTMVEDLLNAHQILNERIRDILVQLNKGSDFPTQDLLTRRMVFHEKAIWMLRSMLS